MCDEKSLEGRQRLQNQFTFVGLPAGRFGSDGGAGERRQGGPEVATAGSQAGTMTAGSKSRLASIPEWP